MDKLAKNLDKALFLDRDGVINVDYGFVHRIEDFHFIDGVFEACRKAVAGGYRLVVVTNQSGIGRGLFTEDEYRVLTDWIETRFRAEGASLAAVYHDPTHAELGRGDYRRVSADRKPSPGMLLKARDRFGLDLARSAIVGDRETDIIAGRTAGVAHAMLVAPPDTTPATAADIVVPSLRAAVDWLVAR